MKIKLEFNTAKLTAEFKGLKSDLDKEIEQAIQIATRNTSANAKSFAPVNKIIGHGPGIKSSIHPIVKGKTGEVVVNVKYAPYQDFGTGDRVIVPTELKDYAMQFKGKGIRKVNTRPQPYLYPAFFINRDRLTKDLEKRMKKVL